MMAGRPVFYNAASLRVGHRRRLLALLIIAASSFLLSIPCWPQTSASANTTSCGHSHAAETPAIPIPEQLLQRPIALENGLGQSHHKVSTSSPEAQAYYDQGRAFLYSYDWIHAARSFREALRRDPNLALAYLGLSYAFSGLGEPDRADAMEGKALQLALNVSPFERLLVDLRLKQLKANRSDSNFKEYIAALDAALENNPSNIDLLLMRGNAGEGFPSAIGQRGTRESIGYYEKVLQLDPNNAAAHHFLIHASEMVNNLPEAVKHGEVYAALAPAVPHAQHMYGHDLRRVGRLSEAIVQFEKARGLAEKSFADDREALAYDWNYRHNLSLLASAYHQAGEWKLAEQTAKELTILPLNNGGDDYYRKDLPALLLELGRYHDALSATDLLIKSRFQIGRMLGHAIAGLAYVGLKQPQQAATELAALQHEGGEANEAWRYGISPWADTLQSLIELRSSSHQAVVARLTQQEREMRSRPGADAWSDALFHFELIEHLSAELDAWDVAELTAKQMQEHAPDYGGTHLALAQIARHQGNKATADHELQLAIKAWSKSSISDLN